MVKRNFENYALKECPQDKTTTHHEFKIVERILTHPRQSLHIVFFYMIYEKKGTNYYLMEYMDQGDFQSVISSRIFTGNEKFLKLLAFQLLNGLVHLHEYYNIVHGDFSPKNILMKKIGNEFFFKIADFGSSVFVDSFIQDQSIGRIFLVLKKRPSFVRRSRVSKSVQQSPLFQTEIHLQYGYLGFGHDPDEHLFGQEPFKRPEQFFF